MTVAVVGPDTQRTLLYTACDKQIQVVVAIHVA